jgi:soluble lytic murein transglycosylase-like protein
MRFAALFSMGFLGTFATVMCFEGSRPTGGRVEAYEAPLLQTQPAPDFASGCDAPPVDFNDAVASAALEFGVDPWVLAVTAYRESDCRPEVTGASGEIGMAQIHPRWWRQDLQEAGLISSDTDLFDMRTNLRASAFIFARLQARGFSKEKMFRRYNGRGPQARKYAAEQVGVLRQVTHATSESQDSQ